MGHFVDGVWKEDNYDPKKEGGQFIRVPSRFRHWITPDGAPGPEGDGGFKAEPDRYHLYIANGCPWAHRTLIFRKLKKLENAISLSIVAPAMVTLLRFDAVYYVLFKCNLRRIADYPNLSNYLRDLYQVPGVAETVNMDHIKRSYYRARPTTNLLGIVPVGPEQDFSRPHDRARFGN